MLILLLIGITKVTDADGNELDYIGEIDKDENACGHGIASSKDKNLKLEGTFFNNQMHGLGN